MRFLCSLALLTCLAAANADPILLQDNYLGKPGDPSWTLPYDGVAAQTSERNTTVTASWTGDDLFVPAGSEYQISRIDWIGLVLNGPGAQWLSADVVIYPSNPDTQGHPIAAGTPPVAQFTSLAMDSFQQRVSGGTPETLFGLGVYDGQVSFAPVTLPAGEYFYAVRVVGNGRGRHFVATAGDGDSFGAGHMGVTQSDMFFTPNWTDISTVLQVPTSPGGPYLPYPTDFSYRVWGTVIPEPGGLSLALFGTLWLLRRR
jgi:hypothetical protein